MFETVRTIFAILREKDRPGEKIVLSLDDLCPIWIKYNSSFKRATAVKETAESRFGTGRDGSSGPRPAKTRARGGPARKRQGPHDGPGLLQRGDRAPQGSSCRHAGGHQQDHGAPRAVRGLPLGVVDTITDSERSEVTRVGAILSKVTLRDHTFNVARIALRLLKDTYHDPVGYIPAVIIAALGHDLGKISELRSGDKYVKADHPSGERLHRGRDIRERQRRSLAQDGRQSYRRAPSIGDRPVVRTA